MLTSTSTFVLELEISILVDPVKTDSDSERNVSSRHHEGWSVGGGQSRDLFGESTEGVSSEEGE